MKRLCILLCLLVLCSLVSGCTRAEPVPEDAFFFSNALEFYRLYCQTPDGDAPRLILDEACSAVCRRGDAVYFIQNQNLYRYDVPRAQKLLIQARVSTYSLAGDCLMYSSFEEESQMNLCWQNLSTGRSGTVGTYEYVWFVAGERCGYYILYNAAYDATQVYALDIATGESKLIWEDDSYGYGQLAMEAGLLYGSWEEGEEVWRCICADGQSSRVIQGLNDGTAFYGSDEKILYMRRWYGEDNCCQIRQLNPDGEDILLAQADPNGDYGVFSLGDGRFLLEHSRYIDWGPMSEYGYLENYALQTQYFYLDSDGTVTPVNAIGESGNRFAGGDFPVIDSSTARKPVTAELYNLFVKNYGYEGPEPLCSTTHGAWINIANGGADLALLAAPTPEEQAYLEQKGVEVEMKLYGGDGLVFIGNKENPVADLTHEQLLDIYRGKITNWEELGGPDMPITVYYRDDQSGSQRLFEKLVWKDAEIPDFEALGFSREEEMSSIVDMVQEDPYSVGYTIMTYLDDVYGEDSLRVFSINGVSPSPETVADGSYAYHTQGYVVIRKDEPADSPARRLYDWFGCAISDELLHRCGVSPLHG